MPPVIRTIGHSNHSLEAFVALLERHAVDVVADVRSAPRSSYSPHFDKGALAASLPAAGIRYVFLGKELGGRPTDPALYDEDGHVRYDALAATAVFETGLQRLIDGAHRLRVAVMCGEEDPLHCHRRLLVGRVLEARGVTVEHIRGSGDLEAEPDVAARDPEAQRPRLFEEERWRSARSVSPRPARNGSSKH